MRRSLFLLLWIAGLARPLAQEPLYRDPGLKTVVQVAIATRDIEATTRRWAELLGVPPPKITTTRPGNEVKMVYRGRPSQGRVKLAFLRVGQVVLEFLEPVGGDSSWAEFLEQHGEGVHHLGFQVTDLDRTVETLRRLGYREWHRGRYDQDNGTYVYFETAPALGANIELLHSDPPRKAP